MFEFETQFNAHVSLFLNLFFNNYIHGRNFQLKIVSEEFSLKQEQTPAAYSILPDSPWPKSG